MHDELKNLDVVALLRDLPADGLLAGEIGTVLLTHGAGVAFEVEFIRGPHDSVVATVSRADLLRLRHARQVLDTASTP
jgi:hypothetical protein